MFIDQLAAGAHIVTYHNIARSISWVTTVITHSRKQSHGGESQVGSTEKMACLKGHVGETQGFAQGRGGSLLRISG